MRMNVRRPLAVGDHVALYKRMGRDYGWMGFNVSRIMGEYCELTSNNLRWTVSPVRCDRVEQLRDMQQTELTECT